LTGARKRRLISHRRRSDGWQRFDLDDASRTRRLPFGAGFARGRKAYGCRRTPTGRGYRIQQGDFEPFVSEVRSQMKRVRPPVIRAPASLRSEVVLQGSKLCQPRRLHQLTQVLRTGGWLGRRIRRRTAGEWCCTLTTAATARLRRTLGSDRRWVDREAPGTRDPPGSSTCEREGGLSLLRIQVAAAATDASLHPA
jgi:hypothetical protein